MRARFREGRAKTANDGNARGVLPHGARRLARANGASRMHAFSALRRGAWEESCR